MGSRKAIRANVGNLFNSPDRVEQTADFVFKLF